MQAPVRSPLVQKLNLLGDPAPAEEPPPEEPLGLDLIRGWLAKPRPRLRGLWLWAPYLAKGIRKGYRWLRANGGPALRKTAETLRKTARLAQALRDAAEGLRARLERTFPPGSRGREVAAHLAGGSRLLLQSALVLVGIGREADRITRVFPGGRVPGKPLPKPKMPPPGAGSAPPAETSGRSKPDEPDASTGAGPAVRNEPADSPGPPAGGHPSAPSGAGSPASEAPRPEPPQSESPQPETSQPEPSGEDPPASGSAGSATADPSPVPGLPPGPRADALAKLPKDLRGQILRLGKRPRKAKLRYTVWRILNERGASTSDDLGLLLEMDPDNLVRRHLSPLVEEGAVQRTVPERINHPKQAYRSTRFPPGAHHPPSGSE